MKDADMMQNQELWKSWYAGKQFSTDWTSGNFVEWQRVLEPVRDQIKSVLEVGSWEGRSAIFFLEWLPAASIVCVDTFGGGEENLSHPQQARELASIEERFDRNLSQYGERVLKVRETSLSALMALAGENRMFDLIYLDGSHVRDDVMIDSILSWRQLIPGGLLIWDDYGGGRDKPDELRVKPAVDAFLKWHKGELEEVSRGYQIIVRKRASVKRSIFGRTVFRSVSVQARPDG